MDKRIKDAFSKVYVSKDLERMIFMKTINKKAKKVPRLLYIGFCLFMFVMITSSIVYAKDIKTFLINTFGKGYVEAVDGEQYEVYDETEIGVKFNKDNFKSDNRHYGISNEVQIDLNTLERMLDLKILKYDKSITNEVLYKSIANQDNEVDRIYIRCLNFVSNLDVSLHIKLISLDASESSKESFLEELNVEAGKNVLEEYESEKLHTKVLVYEYVDGDEEKSLLFTYDNILYELSGFENVSVDNLKEIVESLSY